MTTGVKLPVIVHPRCSVGVQEGRGCLIGVGVLGYVTRQVATSYSSGPLERVSQARGSSSLARASQGA